MLMIHHTAIRHPSRQSVDAAQASVLYLHDGRALPHSTRVAIAYDRLAPDPHSIRLLSSCPFDRRPRLSRPAKPR
ncbi:hypothetical protein [Burkholderia pseudomallei]|uniref:hypothetical protein n=1 Tax=Burkholderia pseudomallei TaxID=28450 RepID=UPI0015E1B63E|nr:hypothetical protein [Burkholderia pseudomallei]